MYKLYMDFYIKMYIRILVFYKTNYFFIHTKKREKVVGPPVIRDFRVLK